MTLLGGFGAGYLLVEQLADVNGRAQYLARGAGKPEWRLLTLHATPRTVAPRAKATRLVSSINQLRHPAIARFQVVEMQLGETAVAYLQRAPLMIQPSLADHLAQEQLTTEQILMLAQRLTRSLAYAHQQGVLHLNLVPTAVLLSTPNPEGLQRARLAEFGKVQLLQAAKISQTETFLAAMLALSPAQLQQLPPTAADDIYMLGCLLAILVTGRPLFEPGSIVSLLEQKERPSEIIDSKTPALGALINRMVAFDPAQRPTSQELLVTLAQLRPEHAPSGAGRNGRSANQNNRPNVHATAPLIPQAWQVRPNISQRLRVDTPWTHGRFRVLVAHPQKPTRIYSFDDDKGFISIGSAAQECDIYLDDHSVDPQHVMMERIGNGWQLLDSGSRNGSYLRDERIKVDEAIYWSGRQPLQVGAHFLLWEFVEHFDPFNTNSKQAYAADHRAWQREQDEAHYWLDELEDERKLELTVEPAERSEASPGEEVRIAVLLHSNSNIVEQVQLRLEGLPASWYTLPSSDKSLLGVRQEQFTLILHPPDKGKAAHKEWPFIIVAYSTHNNRELGRQAHSLHVREMRAHQLDLHPKQLRGKGTVSVGFLNSGNVDEQFLVRARDAGDELAFTPSEAMLTVPAGERHHLLIEVTPAGRRPFFPPGRVVPFEILAGNDLATMQPQAGHLALRPRIPVWALFVVPLLILAAVLLVPTLLANYQEREAQKKAAVTLLAEAKANAAEAERMLAIYGPLLGDTPPEEILQQAAAAQAAAVVNPNAELMMDPALVEAAENVLAAEAQAAAAEGQEKAAEMMLAEAEEASIIGSEIPPNVPPSAIALDKTSIPEDMPPGTAVAVFSSTDPDPDDSHVYTLVAGDGDSHNGMFAVVGTELTLLAPLDFEALEELSVRVQSLDSRGGTHAHRFVLRVGNINEPPTEIKLNNNSIDENQASAIVGTLVATDPDTLDTHSFMITNDDTELFEISGTSLRLKQGEKLDFAQNNAVLLTIEAQDGGDNTFTQTVSITVVDQNDRPTVMGIGFSLLEDSEYTLPETLFLDAFVDGDAADRSMLDRVEPNKIKFTVLPSAGQILLNDAPVYAEQEIARTNLGNLRYVPPPNFAGNVIFRWNGADNDDFALQDAPGTISVIEQSDPPTFQAETAEFTVDEDSGTHNFNWAANIRDEDTDPAELRFDICSNSNRSLFQTQPVVNGASGNLTFTTAENKNGTAVLSLLLTDGTLTCDSLQDRQRAATLVINIEPVNDAPKLECTAVTIPLESLTDTFMTPPDGNGNVRTFYRTRVKDLVGDCGVSDIDGKDYRWFAIISADTNRWSYWQTDDPDADPTKETPNWLPISSDISNTNAILLQGAAWIQVESNGSETSLEFRAWDKSIGSSGDTNVNILQTGSTTAFSDNTATITAK